MQYVYFPPNGPARERAMDNPAASLGERLLNGFDEVAVHNVLDREGGLFTVVCLLALGGRIWCAYVG